MANPTGVHTTEGSKSGPFQHILRLDFHLKVKLWSLPLLYSYKSCDGYGKEMFSEYCKYLFLAGEEGVGWGGDLDWVTTHGLP